MQILIIGGTIFLGRHMVAAAHARGHDVTIFHRGEHREELPGGVHELLGDRTGDLTAIANKQWDGVIDTCGFVPRIVRHSAEMLADKTERYLFISSLSVFPTDVAAGSDEEAPVVTLADETVEEVTGETYGTLKALCERTVADALPGRALSVRPGLIVGPYDKTDRFTYWPRRIARGGEVLAPGQPEAAVQFIDARDLAEWCIRLLETGAVGVYNATGPAQRLTIGETLAACQATTGSDAHFTWMDEQFLLDAGVAPWIELPLWVPSASMRGFMQIDCRKAYAAGLTFRPLADTIRATLAWDQTRPAGITYEAGMTDAKEQAILQQWHARGA